MIPDELRDKLFHDFLERLAELAYRDDEIENYQGNLYHYTSSIGLLGILNTQKIWATEANHLNDSYEIKYGINLVTKKLESFLGNETWISEVIKETISRINGFRSESNIFVACFCENGDLLSQWKGYTNFGDGYSVGLNASELKRTKRKFPQFSIAIRKVIYDKRQQESIIEAEVQETIQKAKTLLKDNLAFQKDIMAIVKSYLLNYLGAQIVRFKSDVFSEEQEWRAIYFDGENKETQQQVQFRSSGKYIIPYVELDIAPSAQKDKWLLPISEIIVGAKIDSERAKHSIELLCKKRSMQIPNVCPSKIHLQ